jgi:hypothetical protein
MDTTLDGKQLTSYYFAIGVLSLFGNDLRFYIKPEDGEQNNFISGMDKVMDDYKDLGPATDDYFNAFSDEDINQEATTDTTAEE